MSNSLMGGFLPLEEMSRQKIEQNYCCNSLYRQVVNLFKNSFLYRICFILHGLKNLKIPKFSEFQNTELLGCFGSIDYVLVLSILFF